MGDLSFTVTGREGELFCLASDCGETLTSILASVGHMPLPPYIQREDDVADQDRYQTVFARERALLPRPPPAFTLPRICCSNCVIKAPAPPTLPCMWAPGRSSLFAPMTLPIM